MASKGSPHFSISATGWIVAVKEGCSASHSPPTSPTAAWCMSTIRPTLPGSLHTRVSRFQLRGDAHQVDPNSEEGLLEFHQPWGNHNGGQIVFGPKGNLWIGTGDGGSAGDPQDNGQKGQTLLGKLLRIDVTSPTEGALRRFLPTIPLSAMMTFLDEIWAYGLRNPWRFSFDRETGDLYIADVGQNAWEEVSFSGGPNSRGGENLRMAHHGGPPLLQSCRRLFHNRPDSAGGRIRSGERSIHYRRIRLPGPGSTVIAGHLLFRRLRFRAHLGSAAGERPVGGQTAAGKPPQRQ